MFQQYLNRGRKTKANHLILDSRNRPALPPYAVVFDSKRNLLRNPLGGPGSSTVVPLVDDTGVAAQTR
jgi:hypothetical protein